jgi:TRAP transporter TAXI family solute receptor
MVLNGEVAAQWGGGVGWPNLSRIMQAGGRLVGVADEQIDAVNARFPFLLPMQIPAGSYPGQNNALKTVGSYSYLLARADLPEDIAYRLAKAIHAAQPGLAARLEQGRDTLPQNTWKAAGNAQRIHPGTLKYLVEIGVAGPD